MICATDRDPQFCQMGKHSLEAWRRFESDAWGAQLVHRVGRAPIGLGHTTNAPPSRNECRCRGSYAGPSLLFTLLHILCSPITGEHGSGPGEEHRDRRWQSELTHVAQNLEQNCIQAINSEERNKRRTSGRASRESNRNTQTDTKTIVIELKQSYLCTFELKYVFISAL